jgi:sec-independent protein translocase protein TatB
VAGVFDLSPDKILMLGFLALVVLGPHRLPDAARTAGRFLGQLRRMSSSFQSEVRDALADPTEAWSSVVTELRPTDLRGHVRQTITSVLNPEAQASPPVFDRDGVTIPLTPDDPSLN